MANKLLRADKVADKYADSDPWEWQDMIRPADRVNLAKDIKKLARGYKDLREQLDAQQWVSADTAPKDGSVIWLSDGFNMRLGFWAKGKEHECLGTKDGGWIDHAKAEYVNIPRGLSFSPTCWSSPPQPPEVK